MLLHGMTFNLGSAKVYLPAIFENISLITKIYRLLELIILCTFTCAISIDS